MFRSITLLGSSILVIAELALLLVLFRGSVAWAQGPQSPGELKDLGDKRWQEKSFGLAAQAYRSAITGDPHFAGRPQMEIRILQADIEAKSWEQAVHDINSYLARYRGTHNEIEGLLWRGRLFSVIDHSGFRVGKRVVHGSDVPVPQDAEELHWGELGESDAAEADHALTRASVLALAELRVVRQDKVKRAAAASLIEIDMDLGKCIPEVPANTYNQWPYSNATRDDSSEQKLAIAWAKRKLETYQRIEQTETLYLSPSHHATVLARLAEAECIGELQYNLRVAASRAGAHTFEPLPVFTKVDPVALLQSTARQFPNDPQAGLLEYTAAAWVENSGDLSRAVTLYKSILAAPGYANWADRVRKNLDSIGAKKLDIYSPSPTEPGDPIKLSFRCRNLSEIRWTAYRVHPELLLSGPESSDPPVPIDELLKTIVSKKDPARLIKAAEWTTHVTHKAPYAEAKTTITSPISSNGAYVICARAGAHDEISVDSFAMVTDLRAVLKIDRDTGFVYVGSAKDGKPVAGAQLTLWEATKTTPDGRTTTGVYHHAVTGQDGVYRGAIAPIDTGRKDLSLQHKAQLFAMAGPDRYALTGPGDFSGSRNDSFDASVIAFVTTDRRLFRPGQEIKYKVQCASGSQTSYRLASNESLKIELYNDQNYHTIASQEVKTDGNGAVSGEIKLGSSVSPGRYTISVDVHTSDGDRASGQRSIEVEEYRKPEFTVSVRADRESTTIGARRLQFTVKATYLFGAPVANTWVRYKVYREAFGHDPMFQSDIGWFSDAVDLDSVTSVETQDTYDVAAARARSDSTGEAVTDQNGVAHIMVDTQLPQPAADAAKAPKADFMYTLEATITDASRRTVTGTSTAIATAARFHMGMRLDRGFALPGDAVSIELSAQDGNDNAVRITPTLSLFAFVPGNETVQKPIDHTSRYQESSLTLHGTRRLVREIRIPSLLTGHAVATWIATSPGLYIFVCTAPDGSGGSIRLEKPFIVHGSDFDHNLSHSVGAGTLLAEMPVYHLGDTARLLLITPQPSSFVLLTEHADSQILSSRVQFVPGRSEIVEYKLTQRSIPNVEINATVIYQGRALSANAGLRVFDPARILTVTVTPDRPTYAPGENGALRLHAQRSDGTPVQGVLSVGVVDEALLALQEYANPDIREFFYGSSVRSNVESIGFGEHREVQSTNQDSVYHAYAYAPAHPAGQGWISDHMDRNNDIIGIDVLRPANAYTEDTQPDSTRKSWFSIPDTFVTIDDEPFNYGAALTINARLQSHKELVNEAGESRYGGSHAAARVRSRFRDTALWAPDVTTDAKGNATVAIAFPDDLTKWHITARAITSDVRVGAAEASTSTHKNLLVRLEAPRFFVEKDEVTLSAIVHNYLGSAKEARVELSVDPTVFRPMSSNVAEASSGKTVHVAQNGNRRVDWKFKVLKPGLTKIKASALTDQESDAAELEFPVLLHGIEKVEVHNGVIKDGGRAEVTLNIPRLRRQGYSKLSVNLSPSLASVMLDALPYLEDYPYGCTEQTLSRFVPTVMVAKALKDAGIDLETLGIRAREIERQSAAVPVTHVFENSGYTYPNGAPGSLDVREMASRLNYTGRSNAPVFDTARLHEMANDGISSLQDLQKEDGSWGWWKGSSQGDPVLTACALQSLALAARAGVAMGKNRVWIDLFAVEYLDKHIKAVKELNTQAYVAYALTYAHSYSPHAFDDSWLRSADKVPPDYMLNCRAVLAALYPQRDKLSPLSLAALALAFHYERKEEQAGVLLRNLMTSAKLDQEHNTVHWEGEGSSWLWFHDKQDATAMALRALTSITSDADLAVPHNGNNSQLNLAQMAVRWLVDNRTGGHWASTRQTANVVEALVEYAAAQHELNPDYTATVTIDGKVSKSYKIDSANALILDNRFLVGDEVLQAGGQVVHISMQGSGTLYWSAYLSYFDESESIKAQNNAISVQRRYFKLVYPGAGAGAEGNRSPAVVAKSRLASNRFSQPVRIPLKEGAVLTSGDIVEVDLFLKSDNDYQYVVFEDMKPAGFEAMETRSGEAYGDGLCSNMELRDQKIAFFLDTLPQGTRRITYKLRAEVPGVFHALPTNGYANYAPDIRGTSDEWKVTIKDAEGR